MKACVNKNFIGCGLCPSLLNVFMEDDGKAKAVEAKLADGQIT